MNDQAFYTHYFKVDPKDWHWPNFTPKEIACKGTGELLVDYGAMNSLQIFRELTAPFSPNSAYRSESHNKAVGGAKNSYHRKGQAFDIPCSKVPRETIHKAAKKAGFKGIIDYPSFVHIDTRHIPYYEDKRK